MAEPRPFASNLMGISDEIWREGCGGWATAAALVLLVACHLLRSFISQRRLHLSGDQKRPPPPPPPLAQPTSPLGSSSIGVTNVITDNDLKELISTFKVGFEGSERWEDVIDKKKGQVSYKAKCCRLKDEPLKYLSVTIFEDCSTELVRDFYMDNEYRKEWDKTWVQHEQLQVDETSGIEVGRTIKKFPLLTAREYILAWRVWEGKDQAFYCFIKDCEHSRAPQQKKYVRVGFFRSGWCIRKVPGRDACEITVVHQEDAGLNVEMSKLAFAKGIWSYVGKMNSALRVYSSRSRSRSPSVVTMLSLIQTVPPALETGTQTSHSCPTENSGGDTSGSHSEDMLEKEPVTRKPSKKWIANGLLLLGGIVCLSRGRSTLVTQIAMACLLKKIVNQRPASGHAEPVPWSSRAQTVGKA